MIDVISSELELNLSKSKIRNLIQSGGIVVNGEKVIEVNVCFEELVSLGKKYYVVRIGGKDFYILKMSENV